MSRVEVKIEKSWKLALDEEFQKEYFADIRKILVKSKEEGKTIYPPGSKIFNAFDTTPFDKVKVVILGQDPYHNPGQAMGLSFSVPKGEKVPPSLRNIYKEIATDLRCDIPDHGDLTAWAEQGVFLLNAMLTVEHNMPSSHSKIGWQDFTDAVIKTISDQRDQVVFMLWGKFAEKKSILIDHDKHLVLVSAHPSPLAGGAFFNNHHFSRANTYLSEHNISPINWQII